MEGQVRRMEEEEEEAEEEEEDAEAEAQGEGGEAEEERRRRRGQKKTESRGRLAKCQGRSLKSRVSCRVQGERNKTFLRSPSWGS